MECYFVWAKKSVNEIIFVVRSISCNKMDYRIELMAAPLRNRHTSIPTFGFLSHKSLVAFVPLIHYHRYISPLKYVNKFIHDLYMLVSFLIGHKIFCYFDNNDTSDFEKTIIKVSYSTYLIALVDLN